MAPPRKNGAVELRFVFRRRRPCPKRWRCRYYCPVERRIRAFVDRSLEADDAVAISQRTVVHTQRLLGARSRFVFNGLVNTAKYQERAGNLDEAIVLLRSALDRRTRRTTSAALMRQRTEADLGRLLVKTRSDEEAEARLTAAIETGRAQGANADARLLTVFALRWLASLRELQSRHAEAAALLEAALGLVRDLESQDSDEALEVARSLAIANYNAENHDVAITQLRRVIELSGRRLGMDDPGTLLARWHLASELHGIGQDAEARIVAETVLAAKRRLLGEHHEHTIALTALLAEIDKELAP